VDCDGDVAPVETQKSRRRHPEYQNGTREWIENSALLAILKKDLRA